MTTEEIQRGTLVIVLEKDRKPPRYCWGLVLKKFPSGNLDVQIGQNKRDTIITSPDQLIFVLDTKRNFESPEEAVAAHLEEIVLQNTLISLTNRDFQVLRRYKRMVERGLRNRARRGLARLFRRV